MIVLVGWLSDRSTPHALRYKHLAAAHGRTISSPPSQSLRYVQSRIVSSHLLATDPHSVVKSASKARVEQGPQRQACRRAQPPPSEGIPHPPRASSGSASLEFQVQMAAHLETPRSPHATVPSVRVDGLCRLRSPPGCQSTALGSPRGCQSTTIASPRGHGPQLGSPQRCPTCRRLAARVRHLELCIHTLTSSPDSATEPRPDSPRSQYVGASGKQARAPPAHGPYCLPPKQSGVHSPVISSSLRLPACLISAGEIQGGVGSAGHGATLALLPEYMRRFAPPSWLAELRVCISLNVVCRLVCVQVPA